MTDGISIHAPAKGATPKAVFVADAFDYFNPRSREGSDGMTMIFSNANTDFNPRSREGSDRGAGDRMARRRDFNPRSREGSDASMITLPP